MSYQLKLINENNKDLNTICEYYTMLLTYLEIMNNTKSKELLKMLFNKCYTVLNYDEKFTRERLLNDIELVKKLKIKYLLLAKYEIQNQTKSLEF